ncbi:MAG: 1,2-phenylacetyl-CoA epoxidase subunit PaaC [Actinomycetota bacterium]
MTIEAEQDGNDRSAADLGTKAAVPPALIPALREHLLAFADDEHLMGQHHTEWIGVAPFLEEDLALSSIGQDELSHAAALYELVLELDGVEATDGAIDELAFRRTPDQFRCSAFVEYPAPDWGETLVRHWIYDMVEELRWSLIAASTVPQLRELAVRASREERYHRRHADALVETLLRSDDGRQRLVAALDPVLPLLPSLVCATDAERELVRGGVLSDTLASRLPEIGRRIAVRFEVDQDLVPAETQAGRSGRSEYFGPILARMLEVFDLDPEATW